MHADPALYHRDICWPNVLWNPQSKKWFLIDFDDASLAPTKAMEHLSLDNHHPSVFLDGHGAEVDIWAVGKLILDAVTKRWVADASEDLIAIGRKLVEGVMTVELALDSLQQM